MAANEVKITSTCRACKGTGIDRHWEGPEGTGHWVEQECENCSGTGEVQAADGLLNRGAKISGDYFDDVIDKLTDLESKLADLEEKIDEIKEVVDQL